MNAENSVSFESTSVQKKEKTANFFEKLVISGPWLFGWMYGVFRFEPSQEEFKISFFSFLLFGVYLLLIGLGRFLVFLIFPENALFYFNSFFCTLYILAGLWSMVVTFFSKSGKKNVALVSSFVDSLFQK